MSAKASRVPVDASTARAARPVSHQSAKRSARAPLAAQRWPIVIILTTLALLNLAGAPYYRLSLGERARSPLHPFLRPSGVVGQSAGLLALLIFLFLWLYPFRKKYRVLAFTRSEERRVGKEGRSGWWWAE